MLLDDVDEYVSGRGCAKTKGKRYAGEYEMKTMIFCGKRYAARRALGTMLDYGMNIVGCAFEEACPIEFSDLCKKHDIPVCTNKQLYEALELGTVP